MFLRLEFLATIWNSYIIQLHTVYNYFGMAKKRIRLIYPENPIWVGNEIGKKGPVNQMAGLVKSSEIW